MNEVTVVGSGPSGVHFALSLLEKGVRVRMIDAGREGPAPVAPDATLDRLRAELEDPMEYFVGKDLYGLALPGAEGEVYGFPPSKRFVFEGADTQPERSTGFEALGSWARGGLARAWTAGVYPFNDAELTDFPFGYRELESHYAAVARRIGVTGERDDLARFMPWHDGVEAPLDLDGQSDSLLRAYERVRDRLQRRDACYMGRSRLAVLTSDRDERSACRYLGRCLWGCPVGALYTPDFTLEACRRYDGFTYEPGWVAESFVFSDERRIRRLRLRALDDAGAPPRDRVVERPVEALALATGTLSTARIFLRSLLDATGERRELKGLMDNRQVLVPFVHPSRIGRAFEGRSYQYHQLSIGLAETPSDEYIHGQITTLTTAQVHPILATMPLDAKTAGYVFRNARAALGLLNLNFHDRRRSSCRLRLDPPESEGGEPVLRVSYVPPADEDERIRRTLKRVRRSLRSLRCVVPPRAVHRRPMGASVHYAGTLPMSSEPTPGTVSAGCRSHDFENLWVLDGSTFPFLPAKNITFSLMANAARVADLAF